MDVAISLAQIFPALSTATLVFRCNYRVLLFFLVLFVFFMVFYVAAFRFFAFTFAFDNLLLRGANMKIYTIIGGVDGTGKSSLTGVLRETVSDMGIIIDADQLSKQYGSNLVGGKAAVRQCINTDCSFTQETTLSGSKTMRTIKLAQGNGYYIRMYYIGLGSVEESIERIANRHRKGGHTIPEADVCRRYTERFDSLLDVMPLCNEIFFYDNENGFVEVGRYRCGEMILRANAPACLDELRARYDKRLNDTSRDK